jgi:hypothetical protein
MGIYNMASDIAKCNDFSTITILPNGADIKR